MQIDQIAQSMYQNLKTAKERSNPNSDKKKKKDKPK